MVKRVTVVKFGVDNGGSNGRGCFEVKVRTDAKKLTNVIIAGLREGEIWSEKEGCSSKMKPRLRAEWVVLREELCI